MHMEQVDWGMDDPLGVMLPDLHGKAVPAEYRRLLLDTEVLPITETELAPRLTPSAKGGVHEGGMHEGDAEGGVANDDDETNIDDDETNIADKGEAGKDACIETKTASKDKVKTKTKTSHKSGDFGIVPEEEGVQRVLRPNNERMYKKDGTARPKDYILDRLKAVEGMSVDKAVGTLHKNSKGVLTPYRKKDLNYDVECGWLQVEMIKDSGERGHRTSSKAAHATRVYRDKAEARPGTRHAKAIAAYIKARREGRRVRRSHKQGKLGRGIGRELRGFMAALRAQGATRSDMGKLNAVADAKAYMAMRDVKWQDHLHSTDHDAIMKAYHAEWDALKASILIESDPSHPEYAEAVRRATGGRCILEFKRTGAWKVRVVVRGYKEDKVYLDGEGFDYAANVCEIGAVRNLLFEPRDSPYGAKSNKTDN